MDATFSGLGTPVDVLTARLVGWLAFWAVAPHFSHAVCYLELLLPVVACAVRLTVRRFRGVESLVCVLGCLRRENQRGARTARFSCVFGARCCVVFAVVLFFCYRGCVPGWLPGCRGACFLN